MELRQIKYFVTVAEELNFRRAAERLYMEQPPLSRQIRHLEEELGVELFHRTKRSVTLTEAGHAFLEEARLTLAQAEMAVQAAKLASRGKQTTLKIGFSICAFNRILPEIIQAFRQDFPHIEINLLEMPTAAQVQALQASEIDVGFLHLPIHADDLQTEVVIWDQIVAVLPENHPLVKLPQLSLRSLAEEPFVLFPRHVKPDYYDQIINTCQHIGFAPRIVQEATPPEVAISFVGAGVGVSLVTAIHQEKQNSGVVFRQLAEAIAPLEIAIAWQKNNKSSVVHSLIDVAKKIKLTN
ncbi:LysR family transcriptional regulator [Nostocales cyanobacterium HT-58-2]|nr:LysR family transcriptional regulator [Nostocales cyanobacterium HT-58-2]